MEAINTLVEDARGEIAQGRDPSRSRNSSDSSTSADVEGERTLSEKGRDIDHTDNAIYGSREASVIAKHKRVCHTLFRCRAAPLVDTVKKKPGRFSRNPAIEYGVRSGLSVVPFWIEGA